LLRDARPPFGCKSLCCATPASRSGARGFAARCRPGVRGGGFASRRPTALRWRGIL